MRLVSAPRHRALGGGLLGGRLPAPRPLCQGWQESCCCRQHVSCSVPVPEQCQCLTVVSASSETQEMCLEHEVSWTTCSSSAEGLSAAKLQGQPFSPFKYKHRLHSKLFFFPNVLISFVGFLHYSEWQQMSREANHSHVQALEGCASLLGAHVILSSMNFVGNATSTQSRGLLRISKAEDPTASLGNPWLCSVTRTVRVAGDEASRA